MNKLESLKYPQYGNYVVFPPDSDDIMFRCTKKRADWYIDRDLAILINDDTIRLTFKPNGLGHANDQYFTQKFENKCVVCGAKEQLTRHHIVPNQYRKYFPRNRNWRQYWSYDVLSMCVFCHKNYEHLAARLKQNFVDSLKIPKRHMGLLKKDHHLVRLLRAVMKRKRTIPIKKYNKMKEKLKEDLGIESLTKEDCQSLINKITKQKASFVPTGKLVVESISDINEFAINWRKHFIKHTKPKFLPKYWDPERVIYENS